MGDRKAPCVFTSGKSKSTAVKFQITTTNSAGRIVNVSGPWPASYHGAYILRNIGLLEHMEEGELTLGDVGYRGFGQIIIPYYGAVQDTQRASFTLACDQTRAMIENVNSRLKF